MLETMRSFIAFDIREDSILERIGNLQSLLRKTGANLKLVKPENIHMTMRFLGNINPAKVEKIFSEMKRVQFTPFDVKIHGIGVFPHIRFPRILWAGITEGVTQLRNISNQMEPRLTSLGFSPDKKGFSPHLTLARVRSGRNRAQLADFVKENSEYEFGVVKAECLRLKRSNLTPEGPIYSTLKEFCPER